jgi:dTDP-D-glucose 4,6-dehydratase
MAKTNLSRIFPAIPATAKARIYRLLKIDQCVVGLDNFATRASSTALSPLKDYKPTYRDFRSGDARHSLADISKAKNLLGYAPTQRIGEGLKEAMDIYVNDLAKKSLLSVDRNCDVQ